MSEDIEIGIDLDKLKSRLSEIEAEKAIVKEKIIDPCRGLKGDLRKKMIAGMAGHRSGNLTEEELKEIEKIQSEYDTKEYK